MKKYRCPKCGETFQGEQTLCPKCKVTLHYRKKEETKQEEAKIVERFNFDDPDVVKHEDKVPETPLIEKEEEEAKAETTKATKEDNKIVANGESFFDGGYLAKTGLTILAFLFSIITVLIGTPWAVCWVIRYDIKHTVIQGHRLAFDGKGAQLLGRFLLWLLLFVLTATIFGLWIPTYFKKWKIKHILFAD